MKKPLLVIGNRNYSSWSLRAWLAARKGGLDFDVKRLPLDTDAFRNEIGAYSPTRRVPVLLVDDAPIWDSLAISEYINEVHAGGALWPRDARARAVARAVVAEMHSGFTELRSLMPMNIRARNRRVERTRGLEREVSRVQEIWQRLRAEHRRAGPWLFGDFSIADAFYAPVAFRFLTYGVEFGPAEAEFIEQVRNDPDVREWTEEAEREHEVIGADEAGADAASAGETTRESTHEDQTA